MSNNNVKIKIRGGLNITLVILVQVFAFGLLWLGSRLGLMWSIPIGIAFSFLLLTNYALMHEAAHHVLHKSRRINYLLGVLTNSLFPKSYTMFEVTHKMHHIGNRTDHEMFDHFYPSDNRVFRYIQWYGILTGLHYLLVPVGSFMIAAVPWLFHTRLFKKSKFSNILFEDFKGWILTKVRLETLFIVAYWTTLWILLGFAWQTVLIFYVCFGFNWSTRQYVTHAWTPRDVMEGAANLKASRVMGLILLNGQWDHAHHRYPFLPWTELTNEKYHIVEPVSYFSQYLSLWKGPRMTLVPGPSVMAEADQLVNVIYE